MRKIAIAALVLVSTIISIQAEHPPAHEELQSRIIGTSWEWDGNAGEPICFQADGSIGHPGWSDRGLITSWQVTDTKTILLKVEKGRSRDLYAILTFSDDYASFSGFNFHGGAKLQISRKLDHSLKTDLSNIKGPEEVLPESGKPDLVAEKEIEVLEKEIDVGQSTPYLEVLSVKVHKDLTKTRCCIGMKFTSRKIKGAMLELSLMDKAGGILGHARHFEEVGPSEQVIVPGHNLDMISEKWDTGRAIWLDFPQAAIKAVKFRLVVSSR